MYFLGHQGDVNFFFRAHIPADAKVREGRVLVLGEATGHAHTVAEADADRAVIYDLGDQMFLRVTGEGSIAIEHPQHKTVVLAPDEYEIVIAREYTDADAEADFRPVVD